VDVARAVAGMAHIALLLQNGEKRADGGGARRIGDLLDDLRGRGAAQPVERVHDLALAAGETPLLCIAFAGFANHAKILALRAAPVNRTGELVKRMKAADRSAAA